MKIISLALLTALTSCASSPTAQRYPNSAPPTSLTVITTTDFHGALEAQTFPGPGGAMMSIGGAGYYAFYINAIRAKAEKAGTPTLLIDAGDLFQGTMASNLFEGAPVIRLYNYLNVAGAAVGNHEFDFGPVGDKAVPTSPGDDAQGALKARAHEANFPFLASNLRDSSGRSPDWVKPSLLVDVGGVKVGIVGASDVNTPSTTNVLNLKGLTFLDPYEPVMQEAQRLRQQGAAAVILTIHLGAGCEDNDLKKVDDLSSCKITDVFNLVKKFPAGLIDMVVAGHTHRVVAKRIGRTLVMQAASSGQYVGWATIPLVKSSEQPTIQGMVPVCSQVVNTPNGKTCDSFQMRNATGSPEPATLFGAPVSEDQNALALIKDDMEKVRKMKDASLGSSATDAFIRNFNAESPLGNLIADVSRDALPGIDVGLTNAGGVRANFNPGPLTYGSVFNVLPFDNQIAVMDLDGATLSKLVEIGLFGGSGVYMWSSNLKLETSDCTLKSVTLNGQAIDPTRHYKVATSDFLAGGGSGVSKLKLSPDQVKVYWDRPYILRDLVANAIRKWNRPLAAKDFYDPANPRQVIHGKCETAPKGPAPASVTEYEEE